MPIDDSAIGCRKPSADMRNLLRTIRPLDAMTQTRQGSAAEKSAWRAGCCRCASLACSSGISMNSYGARSIASLGLALLLLRAILTDLSHERAALEDGEADEEQQEADEECQPVGVHNAT
eukprot:2558343-Prymnesium_polylepis.1